MCVRSVLIVKTVIKIRKIIHLRGHLNAEIKMSEAEIRGSPRNKMKREYK